MTPEPLVALDVDLSRLDGFMLDTVRLLGSELWAISSGDEFKAAVGLWCRAWKQRPAASLPDDERVLASFVNLPPGKWRKVRAVALRGFVKCSDGRLYHPVLAADALRAAEAMRKRHERTKAATEARTKERDVQRNVQRNDSTDDERNVVPKTGRDGTDKEKEEPNPADGRYVFAGRVIRLNRLHFDEWRRAYHAIPDLTAKLRALDDYYSATLSDAERGNWFIRCSTALAKDHQEWALKSKPLERPPAHKRSMN